MLGNKNVFLFFFFRLSKSGHSSLASSFRVVVEGNGHERSVNLLERIRRSQARLPYNESGKKTCGKIEGVHRKLANGGIVYERRN